MILSSFGNENSLIRIKDEEPVQIRMVIKEVESRLRFDVCLLDNLTRKICNGAVTSVLRKTKKTKK